MIPNIEIAAIMSSTTPSRLPNVAKVTMFPNSDVIPAWILRVCEEYIYNAYE